MLRITTLRMYDRRLDVPAPRVELPAGVTLAVADHTLDAEAGAAWHPDAEQRLRDGQTCVVARHGKDVVAYCWMAGTPVWVSEIDHAVVPGPKEVYLYDAFTVPAWRGRGLFPALLALLLAQAATRGRTRALIFANTRNLASRRAIERVGFQVMHTVSRVELLGRRRLWFRGPRGRPLQVTLVPDRRR